MTTKQHQILAVEPTRQKASDLQLAECTNTFSKKPELFTGQTRVLEMFGKNDSNSVEMSAIEAKDTINTPVQYTVPQNLNYMAGIVGSYFDVVFQKECTNQDAAADVVIDGKTIIKNAPAVYLLGMETKLAKLRDLYASIPTLAPGVVWSEADEIGRNIHKSPQIKDVKTETLTEHVRLPQSSDKHPDQFVEKKTNKNVGQYTNQKFSGMMSVADKAELIARLDRLLMAVKDARMRANDVEAVTETCSMNIFSYIHGKFHNELEVKAATAS